MQERSHRHVLVFAAVDPAAHHAIVPARAHRLERPHHRRQHIGRELLAPRDRRAFERAIGVVAADADIELIGEQQHDLDLAGGMRGLRFRLGSRGQGVGRDRIDPRRRDIERDADALLGDFLLMGDGGLGFTRRGAEIVHPRHIETTRGGALAIVDRQLDSHHQLLSSWVVAPSSTASSATGSMPGPRWRRHIQIRLSMRRSVVSAPSS